MPMPNEIIVIFAVLLISLFIGTPVFCSIGFTSVICAFFMMGPKFLMQFGQVAYTQSVSMNQLIAPLFILMAELLARGGVADDLFGVLNKYLGKLKGGLALSTMVACTVFAALCGSSPATAASIGRISISAMTKRGYDPAFSVGTVAGGGTLGIMIPPSIALVTFGLLTETSIAKLLIAGILPGLLLSFLMCSLILIRARLNPRLVGAIIHDAKGSVELAGEQSEIAACQIPEDINVVEKKTTLAQDFALSVPALLLIFMVLGSMYTGLATPTESAGFGVIMAFIILIAQKRMSNNLFRESMKATARTSCMIIFMMISGFCLSYVISYLGIAQYISTAITQSGMNRWAVVICVYILWLILGCLMDPAGMVILTIPFIFPTLTALGFDPIWIGVVSTLCIEIGMITPPVGLNLFVLKSSTTFSMAIIIKGAFPYICILIFGLVILSLFPAISLVLPSLMS